MKNKLNLSEARVNARTSEFRIMLSWDIIINDGNMNEIV